MEIHSKNITSYIDYLKNAGYTVTLHGSAMNKTVFMKYNYHQNPYCHYVKTVYGKWDECICRQEKVGNRAKNGAFFGCCFAGVGEFVYPVKVDNDNFFISVSGYKAEQTAEKSRHFALKYGLPPEEIENLTKSFLKSDIPEKKNVDAVIMPLVFMLESYFSKSSEKSDESSKLYHRVLRYVTENCHSRITMKQLGEKFNYSVSTISHLFLKNSGKSLPEYIDDLRLSEAKWYLLNSNTSITEIALFLGYSSSNYFSSVFKAKHGLTPREYRKEYKK